MSWSSSSSFPFTALTLPWADYPVPAASSSRLRPNTDYVHGRQHSGSAISSTSWTRPTSTWKTDATLVDPAWISRTQVPIDRDRHRPRGAIEASSYGGCPFIRRFGSHRLTDQVGLHERIGREQREQSAEIPPRAAARNASTTSWFSSRSICDVDGSGLPGTSRRARLANWRTAVPERPMTALTSSNGYPNTSCRTNAALSAGAKASRTTCIASTVFSASNASASDQSDRALRIPRLRPLTWFAACAAIKTQPSHDGREPGGQVVDRRCGDSRSAPP